MLLSKLFCPKTIYSKYDWWLKTLSGYILLWLKFDCSLFFFFSPFYLTFVIHCVGKKITTTKFSHFPRNDLFWIFWRVLVFKFCLHMRSRTCIPWQYCCNWDFCDCYVCLINNEKASSCLFYLHQYVNFFTCRLIINVNLNQKYPVLNLFYLVLYVYFIKTDFTINITKADK